MKNIEIKVFCSVCGHILEIVEPSEIDGDFVFNVKPCENCKKEIKNEQK